MRAPPPTPPTPNRPRRRWRLGLFVSVLAICVMVALAAYLHQVQETILSQARAQAILDASKPTRPLAEVTQAVRSMKLITVEIDTKVKVERGDVSWRGDVVASVESPVRLSYGTDLSTMDVDAVTFSSLMGGHGSYIVKVPRPTRIATELFNQDDSAAVRTGWLRLRSRAGEYYLSQARKDLPGEARDLVLLPEDAAKVEAVTKQQVAAMVKSIVGQDADIVVVFS